MKFACLRCLDPAVNGPFCADHAPPPEPERKRRRRPTWHQGNHRWRRLSREYLAENPLCVRCGRAAVHVDHIKAVVTREGFRRRYDRSNLQALCISCHSKKTAREKSARA